MFGCATFQDKVHYNELESVNNDIKAMKAVFAGMGIEGLDIFLFSILFCFNLGNLFNHAPNLFVLSCFYVVFMPMLTRSFD